MEGPAFINIVEKILQQGEEEEIKFFVGLSQHLWLRMNELVYEGKFSHPKMLVQRVKNVGGWEWGGRS
jgi:hypothetical protein